MKRRGFLQAVAGSGLPGVATLTPVASVLDPGKSASPGPGITSTAFSGLRMQHESALSFELVLGRLRAQLGATPVNLPSILALVADEATFAAALQRYIGPTGFMLFSSLDHGAWLAKFGIRTRQVRLIFGNPLIAVTMMRQDLNAGLFVPIELLLTESGDQRGCRITYVLPSSQMVVTPNPALMHAARELDDKLAALVAVATGG